MMKRYYGRNMLAKIDPNDESTFNNNPYPQGFSKVNVKPGQSGNWAVVNFEAAGIQCDLFNLRLIRDGRPERVVPPGKYTRLQCGGAVVMSDTPAEAHEHFDFYSEAHGDVLMAGLGLGFSLQAILTKPMVKSVTVIEKSKDVIKLVKPSITDKRVRIINADIFSWVPPKGKTWTVAWFDIWNDIDSHNLPEMKKLIKKFARKAGWKGCWSACYN